MAVLRALPNRAWSAVVALVVLASLGVAVVLGAGLDAWQSTVTGSSTGSPAGLSPQRGPGVITLPGQPRGPQPAGPSIPDVPGGDGVAGPVAAGPDQPVVPVADNPGGPAAQPPTTHPPVSHPPVTEPPTVQPPQGTPGVVTGHKGTPAGAGQGDFRPVPGGKPTPTLDGHGNHRGHGKHLGWAKHHGRGHGHHYGHAKHHMHGG